MAREVVIPPWPKYAPIPYAQEVDPEEAQEARVDGAVGKDAGAKAKKVDRRGGDF